MGRLLIVTQVYPPETAAVGQYIADLAEHLVSTGRAVTVVTSASGYTNPDEKYPARETRAGVDIIRLPASSFGKASIAARLGGATSFLAQSVVRSLRGADVDRVLVSTSPPMAALAGVAIAKLLRVPLTYWVMDINPDQAVAMDVFSSSHPAVRIFDRVNRWVLTQAEHVVTLDSYMAERLRSKVNRPIAVLPPWPLDNHVEPIAHADNPFRERHGWRSKTVVMFSGNMSPTSPIDTIVDAAARLRDRKDIVFAFIGSGDGKRRLERRLRNEPLPGVVLLPFQPLSELRFSLSAADAHVVTMGDAMVGITHPCKVYTAMAVGRPLIAIAPKRSHIGELVDAQHGWRVDHGDVDGATAAIEALATQPSAAWTRMGEANVARVKTEFSSAQLRARMAEFVTG